MKITAVKCKLCGDTIYSRARHDFHRCSCGKVAIDGGQDYTAVTGEPANYDNLEIDVKTTIKKMYNDWDTQANKLGVIKSK